MKSVSINKAYKDVLKAVHHSGYYHVNKRTGVGVRIAAGSLAFKLSLQKDILPIPGNRRYYPRSAAVETAWQLMGTKDATFIMERAPSLWKDFLDDKGEVATAYGYRWRHHFGRDQLMLAIEALRNDPTNRQVYVSAWDPAVDGLGTPGQPANIPCPVGFSLSISHDMLHCSVFIRSSDVVVGLPYDIMNYALLMKAIAVSLGCACGSLTFTLAHAHYYETHEQVVYESLNTTWRSDIRPQLPGWGVQAIIQHPENYITRIQFDMHEFRPHTYVPKVGAVA